MTRAVDVTELIDKHKISPYQYTVALMAWLALFLDGVDNQSIAYVAPALSKDWGLVRGALGPVFAAGVVGVAVGALVIGPLADRFGRRLVTVATVFYVALFSFLVSQSAQIAMLSGMNNLTALRDLRLLTGLGLGAVVPVGVVIANEFAPKRRRAAMVTLMGCGYAIGSSSGGVLASHLVPTYGWQAQFYVACVLTLLLAAALWMWLPESIQFLTIKGRNSDILKILMRINPTLHFEPGTKFILRQEVLEKDAGQFRIARLFMEGRTATTILIWSCLFVNLLALNYLNNWLPILTVETGLPQVQALRAAASLQFGGILGVVALGFLSDRFGFFKVLAIAFAVGGLFIGSIGFMGGSFYPLAATIFAAGFCNIGTQITLAALAATLYPTDIRSTGVNWAHGVARMLSIISVLIAGALLAQHWTLAVMYSLAALPMFFGSIFVLLLSYVDGPTRRTPAQSETGAVA